MSAVDLVGEAYLQGITDGHPLGRAGGVVEELRAAKALDGSRAIAEDELIELRAFRQSATSTIEILTEAAAEAHDDLAALRAAVRTLLPLAEKHAIALSTRPSRVLENAAAIEVIRAAQALLSEVSR